MASKENIFAFSIIWLFYTGAPTATTATLCWASHPAANAGRVRVLRGLTVGATLLLPATRMTGTDRSSATVIRVTQVGVGSITASTSPEHLSFELLASGCSLFFQEAKCLLASSLDMEIWEWQFQEIDI